MIIRNSSYYKFLIWNRSCKWGQLPEACQTASHRNNACWTCNRTDLDNIVSIRVSFCNIRPIIVAWHYLLPYGPRAGHWGAPWVGWQMPYANGHVLLIVYRKSNHRWLNPPCSRCVLWHSLWLYRTSNRWLLSFSGIWPSLVFCLLWGFQLFCFQSLPILWFFSDCRGRVSTVYPCLQGIFPWKRRHRPARWHLQECTSHIGW